MILNVVPEGLEFPLKHTQSQYAKFWYMSWRSRVGIENKVYQLPVMGRIRWSTDWFKALAPSMVSVSQWWVWNTVLAYHPEVTLWQSRKQTSLVRWSRWTNTKIIGHGGLKFLRKVVLWTFFCCHLGRVCHLCGCSRESQYGLGFGILEQQHSPGFTGFTLRIQLNWLFFGCFKYVLPYRWDDGMGWESNMTHIWILDFGRLKHQPCPESRCKIWGMDDSDDEFPIKRRGASNSVAIRRACVHGCAFLMMEQMKSTEILIFWTVPHRWIAGGLQCQVQHRHGAHAPVIVWSRMLKSSRWNRPLLATNRDFLPCGTGKRRVKAGVVGFWQNIHGSLTSTMTKVWWFGLADVGFLKWGPQHSTNWSFVALGNQWFGVVPCCPWSFRESSGCFHVRNQVAAEPCVPKGISAEQFLLLFFFRMNQGTSAVAHGYGMLW